MKEIIESSTFFNKKYTNGVAFLFSDRNIYVILKCFLFALLEALFNKLGNEETDGV